MQPLQDRLPYGEIVVELQAVGTTRLRSCFGFLSGKGHTAELTPTGSSGPFYLSEWAPLHTVETSSAERRKYVLQLFTFMPPFHYLLVNEELCSMMGFVQGQQVIVEPPPSPPIHCTSVELHPITWDDWTMVETAATQLEEDFLEQVKMVQCGSPITIFTRPYNNTIRLLVGTCSPCGDGNDDEDDKKRSFPAAFVISNSTSVIVIPPVTPQMQQFLNRRADLIEAALCDESRCDRPLLKPSSFSPSIDEFLSNKRHSLGGPRWVLRVPPKASQLAPERLYSSACHNLLLSFNFALVRSPLSMGQIVNGAALLVRMESTITHKDAVAVLIFNPALTKEFTIDSLRSSLTDLHPTSGIPYCWLSPYLRRRLGEVDDAGDQSLDFTHIIVKSLEQHPSSLKFCDTFKVSCPDARCILGRDHATEKVLAALAGPHLSPVPAPLVFSLSAPISIPITSDADETEGGIVYLQPHSSDAITPDGGTSNGLYGYFWPHTQLKLCFKAEGKRLEYSDRIERRRTDPCEVEHRHSHNLLDESRLQMQLIEEVEKLAVAIIHGAQHHQRRKRVTNHILLRGERGAGKSTILYRVGKRLAEDHSIACQLMDWRSTLKGYSENDARTQLKTAIARLSKMGPSVMLIDNVDALMGVHGGSVVEDGSDTEQLTTNFGLLELLEQIKSVLVVATTCDSDSKLTNGWLNSFTHQIRIGKISNKKELQYLPADQQGTWVDNMAEKAAENGCKSCTVCTMGERVRMAERMMMNPFVDSMQQKLSTNSSQAAGKRKSSPGEGRVTFADVGGLHAAKQRLTEIFLWANRYENLYQRYGITLGRGAILHGPSGCGKSLLLRALRNEVAMDSIFIRGPELLSKYIGESEENIRRVFQQARASVSMLLVFDEFDALVPMRGHDSTGVTDRVVNQFLTEMDGLESDGRGVHVVAATNRLHTIDKALLREGRFDHKILIEGPEDTQTRLDILRLHLDPNTFLNHEDLEEMARMTNGKTGAELRAILANAMFLAKRECTESGERLNITHTAANSQWRIGKCHMHSALLLGTEDTTFDCTPSVDETSKRKRVTHA